MISIIAVLLGLILGKRYEYHYVYSHSSNELPMQYVISCLWEGQEGSFLLWMFWQSVIALFVVRKQEWWVPGVMLIVSSVQAILASMILGVYVPYKATILGLILLLVVPVVYYIVKTKSKPYALSSLLLASTASLFLANILFDCTGSAATNSFHPAFAFQWVFLIGTAGVSIFKIGEVLREKYIDFLKSFFVVAVCGIFVLFFEIDDVKVGSSPFLLLRETNPELTAFGDDFVPKNGKGLNALLQNYWMVIHPPTLFLGFSFTLFPFAFALAGLMERRYGDWVRPASPFSILSAMVLGLGIMMGGYWAYETLNFGGYWNWDPVENASLAPWLTAVGSIHAMLSYRKGKGNLGVALWLCIATFLLVLYSTFLTRSGVLGESSVHSFTDLGLSGQLLLLILVYVAAVLLAYLIRKKEMPEEKDVAISDGNFFLFVAALVLTLVSVEISLVTSLPVVNKLFGTKFALSHVQFSYFQTNVWFAITIAVFSAIGQYFYWRSRKKNEVSRLAFGPFLLAFLLTLAVMLAMYVSRMEFVYNSRLNNTIQFAASNAGFFKKIFVYVWNGLLFVSDELLLLACLFSIFANIHVFSKIAKQKATNIKFAGGSVAHMGFGLMMVGVLFSSGYESVVSKNIAPSELKNFSDEEKEDNVLLLKGISKPLEGYSAKYLGKIQAQKPISNLKVLQDDEMSVKVAFEDANGYRFAEEFPAKFFRKNDENNIDLAKLKFFIEEQLELLNPEMINKRSIYRIELTPFEDEEKKIILNPEAELSQGMGIISHPDRYVSWKGDIYLYVSGIPTETEREWEVLTNELAIAPGDSTT
ncbi:MAG: cytochrome c biogenesis protein CcsA, partial [Bacteroidia bacterium]|nr:cytochrome c biogenesis protein CcsA [Bacteroidia bacterium]